MSIESTKPVEEMTNFEKVIEIAKKVKMDWVEKTQRGDMPPTLFAERGGKCVAVVMAPQVDKRAGLHAATLCRIGLKAAAITLALDAHIKEQKVPEGMSPEQAKEEFAKTYKNGDFQRMCDEEGACERGDISDVLLCHRVDESGKNTCWTMPYSYHGKGGPEFRWMEDHFAANKVMGEGDGEVMEGFIPSSLKEIMAQPAFLDREDEFIQALKEKAKDWEMTPDRQQYHVGRAILRMLVDQGFQVLHLEEPPEGVTPEPLMPLQKTVSLRDLIPEDVGMAIGKLMRDRGDEPTFADELLALLQPHEEAVKANAVKMEVPVEEININEMVKVITHSLKHTKAAMAKRRKPPYKVKVWSGDQSEYWGEGTYVGDVPVFFVATPDGSIRSLADAEVRPSDEVIAQMGGELIEVGDNPKIVLDNEVPSDPGRKVVYGCQCWWEPTDQPGGPEHQHHEGCGCGHDH